MHPATKAKPNNPVKLNAVNSAMIAKILIPLFSTLLNITFIFNLFMLLVYE